ncbi:ATPase [Pedobacter yulinensis]|uniref:ATPase n=2 Tax=Pedobacter yulinensis TaxID=2126353 RepID=A0A2T3HJ38_9SPHI|nr:ATPase [Pedobacter yulinensis]
MLSEGYILTGGPGAGKTTVCSLLEKAGYSCVPESGRAVISQELHTGGSALTWADRSAFARRMFETDLAAYHAARRGTPVFFDRGLPDVAGYLKLEDLNFLPGLENALQNCRYAPLVFIFPPWQEIYVNDAERKQSFAVACRTFRMMVQVYQAYGYRLVEVPRLEPAGRCRFICSCLEQRGYAGGLKTLK